MLELAFFAVPLFAQCVDVCLGIIAALTIPHAERSISVLRLHFVASAIEANPDAHREPSIVAF